MAICAEGTPSREADPGETGSPTCESKKGLKQNEQYAAKAGQSEVVRMMTPRHNEGAARVLLC